MALPCFLHHDCVRYRMRKLRPRFRLQNGTYFPEQQETGSCVPVRASIPGCSFRWALQPESLSRSEPRLWDVLSARHAIWKAYPVLNTQSGPWFPRVLPTGKCVPLCQADGHKLNSSYSSTSLSHVGSAVCRMPDVCSFLVSIPAERTSFMVKRSRG